MAKPVPDDCYDPLPILDTDPEDNMTREKNRARVIEALNSQRTVCNVCQMHEQYVSQHGEDKEHPKLLPASSGHHACDRIRALTTALEVEQQRTASALAQIDVIRAKIEPRPWRVRYVLAREIYKLADLMRGDR